MLPTWHPAGWSYGVRPAFDVTLHRLVTAIITEQGVVEPPFEEGLRRIMQEADTL